MDTRHASTYREDGLGSLVLRNDADGVATLTLNRPEKLNALTPATFKELRAHLDARFVGLALVDPGGTTMTYVALDPLPAATVRDWATFPLDHRSPVSAAVTSGRPSFLGDPRTAEAAFPGIATHMATARTPAISHVPLTADGIAFGTLGVAWAGERAIDVAVQDLLAVVAGYAAQALRRPAVPPVPAVTAVPA